MKNDLTDAITAEIPRLRRYAHALTRGGNWADDLVQDTLERAWSRTHLWRGGEIRAWLFTIMHNVYANAARRYNRGPSFVPMPEDDAPSVAGGQDEAMSLRDLRAALDQLPDEQRQVLLLVGLEQLSYAEVAAILDIPMGTVMSRLSRGRERMRSLLRDDDRPQLRRVK
jgi:RNA polymerase sigma-70 factor (ECF subfamily)